jgi:hypothetical protein
VTELRERDAMICRSCGQEERASEGYPCKDCGTFICIMCVFKGVVRCERCAAIVATAPVTSGADSASWNAEPLPRHLDWPEH